MFWNGTGDSFLAYRKGIEGHLLQAGPGYLLDEHFLAYYIQDPIKYQYPVSYHNGDEVWRAHQVSCEQIKYDKEFFYGLLTTAMRNFRDKGQRNGQLVRLVPATEVPIR